MPFDPVNVVFVLKDGTEHRGVTALIEHYVKRDLKKLKKYVIKKEHTDRLAEAIREIVNTADHRYDYEDIGVADQEFNESINECLENICVLPS